MPRNAVPTIALISRESVVVTSTLDSLVIIKPPVFRFRWFMLSLSIFTFLYFLSSGNCLDALIFRMIALIRFTVKIAMT